MAQRLSRPPVSPPGSPARLPRRGLAPRAHPAAPLWRACLVPWSQPSPRPAFPADGGSRACGGARARRRRRRLRPRRWSFPVAVPARRPRRVSGCAARRRAPVAPSGGGSGLPPTPGGLRALGSRGAPAGRRLPPPALDGSLSVPSGVCSGPAVPRSVSLPSGLPHPCPGLGPGFGSSPSPPLLSPPAASRALPARVPLPAAAPLALCGERGLGSRVRGGTRLWVKSELWGCLGRERGPVRPPRLWRGAGGGGEGMGRGRCRVFGIRGRWRRPAGRGGLLRHGPAASGFPRPARGWPRMGSASRRGGLWRRVPPPASPVSPTPLSRYLARPGAEV